MIREHFENGIASGIELTCDKECTVLDGRTWSGQLSMMGDCIVFIDEGNEFIMSDDFASAIQKTDNYYVIVTREGIPSLPYNVNEIYGIRDSGKYGILKRTYNEFYHLPFRNCVPAKMEPINIHFHKIKTHSTIFRALK